jgi:hypothetical protein
MIRKQCFLFTQEYDENDQQKRHLARMDQLFYRYGLIHDHNAAADLRGLRAA